MKRLMISALVVSIAAAAAVTAGEYDDYVWLSSSDSVSSSSFFDNTNGRWKKKAQDGSWVAEQQGRHAGVR